MVVINLKYRKAANNSTCQLHELRKGNGPKNENETKTVHGERNVLMQAKNGRDRDG